METTAFSLPLTSNANVTKGSTRTQFNCRLHMPLILDPTLNWHVSVSNICLSPYVSTIPRDLLGLDKTISFRFGKVTNKRFRWDHSVDIPLPTYYRFMTGHDVVDYIFNHPNATLPIPPEKPTLEKPFPDAIDYSNCKESVYSWFSQNWICTEPRKRTQPLSSVLGINLNGWKMNFVIKRDNVYEYVMGEVKVPTELNYMFSLNLKYKKKKQRKIESWYTNKPERYMFTHFTYVSSALYPVSIARLKQFTAVPQPACNPLKHVQNVNIKSNLISDSDTGLNNTLVTIPYAAWLEEEVSDSDDKIIIRSLENPMWSQVQASSTFHNIAIQLESIEDAAPLHITAGPPTELTLNFVPT